MKYFLLAGEASGDLHGANLIKALLEEDPQAELIAWGGNRMEAAGALLLKHYRELAFMGFREVVANLRTIRRNFQQCRADIKAAAPNVLILIDYPGFNLRMAKWAKRQGFRIFYYISPQLWAWHSSRAKQIKAYVDRMYVILPFEQAFYAKHEIEVDYVGHPLLDVIADYPKNDQFRVQQQLSDQPIVALLPGSRKQEIRRMLPTMLQLVPSFPDLQFVIAAAPSIPIEFYQAILSQNHTTRVNIVADKTYELLQETTVAIVTSGTATLETALFKVPQMVTYKGDFLSYLLARYLINVPYISLINLILDRPLVKELIQADFTVPHLSVELQKLLESDYRASIQEGYAALTEELGEKGASKRVAKLMVQRLKNT